MTKIENELDGLYEIIDNIELDGFEKEVLKDAIDRVFKLENTNIIYEEASDSNLEPIDIVNTVRMGKWYFSISQLKKNLQNNFFLIGMKMVFSKREEIVINSIKQILPLIICCIHVVTEEEMCVFLRAIELMMDDLKTNTKHMFHSVEEYKPKLLEGYCDLLTSTCSYRHQGRCRISKKNISIALNSLVGKNILEKDDSTNGYKYIQW